MKKMNLNTIAEKASFFVKRRHEFIILILILVIYNMSGNNESLIEASIKKDNYIEKISSQATYITDNGVVKQYEKEQFDVYREKNNVSKVLSDYLIQSAYNLTDGYTKTIFSSNEDLYNYSKSLRQFYENYILIQIDGKNKKEKEALLMAQKDWKQILRWFTNAVNNNDLPQTIDVKKSDVTITTWNTDNNKFNITFEVPVYTNSRNNNNVIDEGVSNVKISATGYYDLQAKSTVNSYGMKFTSLTLTHPQINHNIKKRK